ncbi:MAG: dTDP-4-dehydrorhamnose reductase [Chthoniobacterales bacterium]
MPSPSVVIVGSGGRLGAALLRAWGASFATTGYTRAQLDIADSKRVRKTLNAVQFDLLVNCAAQTNVDRCETHREEAFALNAEAPRVLAEICTRKKARFVHVSTDYVFDGAKREPYAEDDEANPISVYGESKGKGEKFVLETDERHLVVRVSWVFGPDRPSFIDGVLKRAMEQEEIAAVADKFSTPSYTPDLAAMLEVLCRNSEARGIFHLANGGSCSWQEYAQWALDCAHAAGLPLKARTVAALRLADMKIFVARRPPYTVLSTDKIAAFIGNRPRPWREAVAEFVSNWGRPLPDNGS